MFAHAPRSVRHFAQILMRSLASLTCHEQLVPLLMVSAVFSRPVASGPRDLGLSSKQQQSAQGVDGSVSPGAAVEARSGAIHRSLMVKTLVAVL